MKNIAKAIIAVMQEVKGMEKNSRVGSGNAAYDGTKYKDVAERFNEAMAKNELCIIPIDIDEDTKIERWEEENTWNGKTSIKVKQSVFTKVKTKYLLLHSSGESIEIKGYGHGVDPQDKSAGKATTYALKNALLYTFLTPVGKMDDTDTTHSNDIRIPEKKPTLSIGSENYNKVLSAMVKGYKIGDVRKKYTVTSEVENKLITDIKNANNGSK